MKELCSGGTVAQTSLGGVNMNNALIQYEQGVNVALRRVRVQIAD